jgi:hypothetical protein
LTLTTTIGQQLAQGAAAETQPSTTPGTASNQARVRLQRSLLTNCTVTAWQVSSTSRPERHSLKAIT